MQPFDEPIYVTRPLLPDLKEFKRELEEPWGPNQYQNNGRKHQQLEEENRKLLKGVKQGKHNKFGFGY